jgi:hypothetical protein
MKHNHHNHVSHFQKHRAAEAAPAANSEELNQNKIDFAPPAEEVATRAYFSYVNQGSLPGHDVEHWLTAESELMVERQLTRTHGYSDGK